MRNKVTSILVTGNKLLIFFILIITYALLLITPALAVDSTVAAIPDIDKVKAQKFGVTFPIAELGSCSSIEECKYFCELEENRTTCKEYALKKGFHKEEKRLKSAAMIAAAKAALGCGTEEECKAACQKEENKEKCKAFAEKYNLVKNLPVKNSLIARAKELLGCKSEAECKAFCSKEENKQKCAELAATVGAKGGFNDQFCQRNPDKCREFKRIKEASLSAKGLLQRPAADCAQLELKCKTSTGSGVIARQCETLRSVCATNAQGPKPSSTSGLVQGIQTARDTLSRALDWLSSLFL